MNEEIDLREYIDVIIRRWKWIVGLMVASAFAAAVVSLLLPPVYEAKAGVLIRRSLEEVNFESMLHTLSEEELLPGSAAVIEARRKTLVALVDSNAVATLVIDELGERLHPEEREASALLTKVNVETQGDLILIKARDRDPTNAAAIANAWGEAYERYVNELYSERPQSAEDIQAQVVEAWKTYEEAQEGLARFRGDNRIESLNREIEARQNALADYYGTKQGLDRLIDDAKALRDQLHQGPSSSTASDLPTLLLRANASMVSTSLPLQPSTVLPLQPSTVLPLQPSTVLPLQPSASLPLELQLSLGQMTGLEGSAEDKLGDLGILISVLEARREEVQSLISEGSIQQEVLQLQEQLEGEEARLRELTEARDLAWETYSTLARKEAEVEVSAQVTGSEVRFAVSALEPKSPVAPKMKLNIAIAGMLGLMIGVFGAFGVEYLRRADEGKE